MTKLKHGSVEIDLPNKLNKLPDQAGKLTTEDMQRIGKARRGVGLACQRAAEALRKTGDTITVDKDLTPEALIEAGEQAELIDEVIHDVEVILAQLKQANLLLDAHAYTLLRRLNDAVRTQSKYKPELSDKFSELSDFFQNK